MKKLLIALLLVIGMTTVVAAEPATFVDRNAALRYLMGIGFMPAMPDDASSLLTDINSLESVKGLDEKMRKSLADGFVGSIYKILESAAECSECSFIIDQKYNYESIVPPFRTLRLFARFIIANGWIKAENGDFAGAARAFLHVFRLGVNLTREGGAINGMFASSIQRYAVESMENLLQATDDKAVRQILKDYFAALPVPFVDVTKHIYYERQYIENSFVDMEKMPAILAELEMFAPEETARETSQKTAYACIANQKVIMGVMELYMMDYNGLPAGNDSEALLKKLVAEKYLKAMPVCERSGKYCVELKSELDVNVFCSCGASEKSRETEFSAETISPIQSAKIKAYIASSKFATDKQEMMTIFGEIEKVSIFAADYENVVKKLAERVEKSENPLIKGFVINPESFFNSIRENQFRVDSLLKKLN